MALRTHITELEQGNRSLKEQFANIQVERDAAITAEAAIKRLVDSLKEEIEDQKRRISEGVDINSEQSQIIINKQQELDATRSALDKANGEKKRLLKEIEGHEVAIAAMEERVLSLEASLNRLQSLNVDLEKSNNELN